MFLLFEILKLLKDLKNWCTFSSLSSPKFLCVRDSVMIPCFELLHSDSDECSHMCTCPQTSWHQRWSLVLVFVLPHFVAFYVCRGSRIGKYIPKSCSKCTFSRPMTVILNFFPEMESCCSSAIGIIVKERGCNVYALGGRTCFFAWSKVTFFVHRLAFRID